MLSVDTSPRSVYRWATRHGWTSAQAASWAAFCSGIPIVHDDDPFDKAWTMRQIGALLFLRYLADRARIGQATDAPSRSTGELLVRLEGGPSRLP